MHTVQFTTDNGDTWSAVGHVEADFSFPKEEDTRNPVYNALVREMDFEPLPDETIIDHNRTHSLKFTVATPNDDMRALLFGTP